MANTLLQDIEEAKQKRLSKQIETGKKDKIDELVDVMDKAEETPREAALKKQPSIARRMYWGATQLTDGARRAKAVEGGFDPNYDDPKGGNSFREFVADVAETWGVQGGKMATMLAGEAGGLALGGPKVGILGSGVGAAYGQQTIEQTAQSVDAFRKAVRHTPGLQESDFALAPDIYEKEGHLGRVAREGAIGAGSALTGQAIRGVGRGIKFLYNTAPIQKIAALAKVPFKAGQSFLLTNLSRWSKPMQEYAKDNWNRLYKIATNTNLYRSLNETVQAKFMSPLKASKKMLGRKVGEAKQAIMKDFGNVDLAGLADDTKTIVSRYVGNITSEEGDRVIQLSRNLERLNKFAKMLNSDVPVKGKVKGLEALRKRLSAMYIKNLDDLISLGRDVSKGMKPGSPGALSSMKSEVQKAINTKYKLTSETAKAFEDFHAFSQLDDTIKRFVSDDPTEQAENFYKLLFQEPNNKNYWFKESMDDLMKNANRLGINITEETMARMKDLTAAQMMLSGEVRTAGVKAMVPSALLGTAGQAFGPTGGKVGFTAGTMITAPHMIPSVTAHLYSSLEALARSGVVKGGKKVLANYLPQIAARAKLASKPVSDAIESIRRKFMGEEDEEETNK